MADINVERRGPRVWPWIVGLLAVAVLIWLLVEMFGEEEPSVSEQSPIGLVAPAAVPAAPPSA